MSTLYVKFINDPVIYTFFVNMHCKINDAIKDIEKSANNKIEKASYNKTDLENVYQLINK